MKQDKLAASMPGKEDGIRGDRRAKHAPETDVDVPVCIDLDGTLIRSDMLWESAIQMWRRPLLAVRAAFVLLLRGKASMKTMLAEVPQINVATLPYRPELLAYLEAQKAMGRPLVMATATHKGLADRIAAHLGIFSRVFATDGDMNLSGNCKRDALVSAYGSRGFDYIGDHSKDLPIFAEARHALLVNPSPSLLSRASTAGNVHKVFRERPPFAKVLARTLRLHQWAKNVLLGVPLVAAHLITDSEAWARLCVAFLAFGLVASATYIFNDLIDLESDRQHGRKRHRPLPAGDISIPRAISLMVATAGAGIAISLALPALFLQYLALYVVLTLAYSLVLKSRLIVDVLVLSILYTLRILAGGTAVGAAVSEWLLMFSLFLFLSLAFLKRSVELMGHRSALLVPGRGYAAIDIESIKTMGMASGLLSVLVFAQYIGGTTVAQLYRQPQLLWLEVPLLVYWITRIWFMAARGEVQHDPVVFALRDGKSYIIGACSLLIGLLATSGLDRWLGN